MGDGHCSCQSSNTIVLPDEDPFGEQFAAAVLRPRRAAATERFDKPFPAPEYPPLEWFKGPPNWIEGWRDAHGFGPSRDPMTGVLRLTVTDEGRVGGWFFEHGQCLVHDSQACPGPSPTRYAAFHQGDTIVDGGQVVPVGVIGMTHGHASPWLDWKDAQRHYADPTAQMILCRAGDDERGGWIAGAVIPGLSYGDVALLRRSSLSGDWRPMPQSWWRGHGITAAQVKQAEGFDCIGPTLVTRPALPLVQSYAASMGAPRTAVLGGVGGIQLPARVRNAATVVDTSLRAETSPPVTSNFGPGYRSQFGPRGRAARVARTAMRAYSDDQPRDDHGRFGTGGASGNAPTAPAGRVDVDKLLADNPQKPGEDKFEWQSRVVQGLDAQTQSDVLFAVRERYEPVGYIVDGVKQWADEHNLPVPPAGIVDTPVDLVEGEAVAKIFDETPDQSGDPNVQAAYDDFKTQNDAMFDFMTKPESEGGLGIKVDFVQTENPYESAKAQADDLRDNHHISIESGLGGEHSSTMTTDEYDRFRAVHDTFGHAGVGGGFDRHGEYEAWLQHSAMYTPPGRDAMSAEYHGVNSALWGSKMVGDTYAGTGKSILLPEPYSTPPWERTAAMTPANPDVQKIVDALGLDDTFAQKFDHPAWHIDPAATPPAKRAALFGPDRARRAYAEDQARDYHGRFGEGGGSPKSEPSKDTGASLAERFINGEKGLVLPKDDVATFTDKIAAFGRAEKAKGEGSRLNLCEVEVPGTNLFCGENRGIPRQQMPQLKGETVPGSPADSLPKNRDGEADITPGFMDTLRGDGVKMTDETVKADALKSTQNELVGEKVAGIAEAIRSGKLDIEHGDRILVSKDNYILDGHHRWAGAVLNDAEDGKLGDSTMPIVRVDLGILDLVDRANAYANQEGIAQKSAAQSAAMLAAVDPTALRGLAQELAVGQHKTHVNPGKLMSALDSAAAHAERGDDGAAAEKMKAAVKIAQQFEKQNPAAFRGLTAKVKRLAGDTAVGAAMRAAAPTKTEGGSAYKASDYAYVPDASKPSTWKLRLTDSPGGTPTASAVGRAIAALGKGYRGNKVQLPTAARDGVKAKLRSAWKKANPGASASDMPDVIKASVRRPRTAATVRGQEVEIMRTEITLPDGTEIVTEGAPVARTAAASGAADLPLGDPTVEWNPDAAQANITQYASDGKGGIDPKKYGDGFFWFDDSKDPTDASAYELPFADVVDGTLTAIPSGIEADATALNDGTTNVPDDQVDAVKAVVAAYYDRLASELGDSTIVVPWDTAGAAAPADGAGPPPAAPAAPAAPMKAAPMDMSMGGGPVDMGDGGGMGDGGAPLDQSGPPTREEFQALSDRVSAVEEFIDQMMQSEMAALQAAIEGEQPLPVVIPEEEPLPIVK